MKAVTVDPGQRTLALLDAPEPALTAPTQVKLRMLDVGVCGTDKEICAFEYGTPPAGSAYLILGHESLAEVAQVGKQAGTLSPGDLVVTMVRRPCPHGHCHPCRSGRQDYCVTGDFVERGIHGQHGFMSEWVVDEAQYMVPVPRALRDIGVLVEPLTIAEKALEQIAAIQQRLPWAGEHTALILGAGPVGLLGAMALRAAGYRVFVYSLEATPNAKADVTAQIGATYVSAATHDLPALREAVGQIDVVFEATGAPQLAFEGVRILGTNGVFVLSGVPGHSKPPLTFDAGTMMREMVLKNQVLVGTVNAGRGAFEAAIRDLARFDALWPAAVRNLITGRFPASGYEALLLGRAGGIKNVISM
jgi:glucose 1-dehydrogenase